MRKSIIQRSAQIADALYAELIFIHS